MALISSFIKTVMAGMALAACALALTPPQDKPVAPALVPKQSRDREPDELEAAAITRVEPIYPDVARWAGITGTVNVVVLINERGEVIDGLNHALELKSNLTDLYCVLCSAYRKAERIDEAYDVLKKSMQEYPREGCAYLQWGAMRAMIGRFAEAEEAFRKVIELSPDKMEGYANLAQAMITQKKPAEAETVLRQGIKQLPTNVQLHIFLATVLGQLDRRGAAEAELREALRLDPNNPTVLNNLGYNLVERGEKLSEATEMIQRAVNAVPNNGAFLDSLGWAYFKQGRLDEAERYLKRATEGEYQSSAIFEHLGDLYDKQGKTALAHAAWQKALFLSTNANNSGRLRAKLDGAPQAPKPAPEKPPQ